jgi:NhaP-type Na+/H+ or K+/H+ antiporter
MFFYLIVATLETGQIGASLGEFSVQLLITLFASLIVGIAMILFFKFLDAKVKLFFFIAILILMYEIFKLSHLSPLFLILIFGLILKNPNLFFRGKLSGIITRMEFIKMERDFHIVTRETAFILRTFFFIIFGLTIELQSLFSLDVLLLSLMAFILILILRILLVNGLARQASNVVTYVAPRGLITILLFYSIPGALESAIFKPSIVLWVVLITSLFMSFGLIRNGRKENEDEVSPEPDVG